MTRHLDTHDRVVITGIGLVASVGDDREAVWQAVRSGRSGVRMLHGIQAIPDGMLAGAPVDLGRDRPGPLKTIALCHTAADEALTDSGVDLSRTDLDRFGCTVSGHMGDTDYLAERAGRADLIEPGKPDWWSQWMPNSACCAVANTYQLRGPRLCHSTACSSGMIDVLAAVRSIRDGQCDLALAGGAEVIHPLFAAGFQRMRVLANDPDPLRACRPFDLNRSGFVMGEGAAMLLVERLSHATARRARIYAELVSGVMLADAYHVTGLDSSSDALAHLITIALRRANLKPGDIGYINAHGTATKQNDVMEVRGIRRAMGSAADRVWISSTKSMLGHLINASGSIELAITALSLRDGFAPPTVNLTDPDPECDLDCLPQVGRRHRFEHALKISVAFGGHLAAIVLRRWNDGASGFEYPAERHAA